MSVAVLLACKSVTNAYTLRARTAACAAQIGARLEVVDTLARQYAGYQELFGIAVYAYKALARTREQFAALDALWRGVERWACQTDKWMNDPLRQVRKQ
jgi:hypothetical protein